MGWILADVKKRKLTRNLAEKFRTMQPIKSERLLNPKRIAKLRKKVVDHGALPFRWAVAEVAENEESFRVNGQHTSTLFSTEPDLITEGMVVNVEYYMCDTMGDLGDLYSQIDSSDSSRTVGDINKSTAATIPELDGCNKRIIDLAVNALSRERWGSSYIHQLKEDRAALLADEPSFVLFLQELRDNMVHGDWKALRRAPVTSAMLATWRKNRRESKKFWLAVGRMDGSDANSADRKLGKYLVTTGVSSGRTSAAQRIGGDETHHTMYSRCVVAWNAWRRNKPTALRIYQGKTPVPV